MARGMLAQNILPIIAAPSMAASIGTSDLWLPGQYTSWKPALIAALYSMVIAPRITSIRRGFSLRNIGRILARLAVAAILTAIAIALPTQYLPWRIGLIAIAVLVATGIVHSGRRRILRWLRV